MGIKVSSISTTSSTDTSGKTMIQNAPSEESFQDVLVLNQTALKAMTIDAMVKESSTGSVDPESINAAAIMKFRSTLGANIKAPVPTEDWNPGTPIKVHVPVVKPPIRDSVSNNTTNTNSNVASNNSDATTPSTGTPVKNEATGSAPILGEVTENLGNPNTESSNTEANHSIPAIPNAGVLKCSDELNQYFKEASETYGVDLKLLKCIAYAESNFDPKSTSRSGAMGIMQLMPKTAEGLGVRDAYDPRQNILGGAKYIATQLERFNGNIEYALAAYNAGPGAVKKHNGIPPYEETQNYVKKIMNIYNN